MIPMSPIPLIAALAASGPAPAPAPAMEPVLAPVPVIAWTAAPAFQSYTERRSYLRVSGGLVTTEDSDGPDEDLEFDEGYLLGLAFGRRMGASENGIGFGLELEGLWTDQDADSDGPIQAVDDVTVIAALLNGTIDYRIADAFTIYGGAGIGAAWLDVGTRSDSINDFDDEDGPFLAWQLRAGAAWHVGENTSFNVGYRFLNIDDAEIDDDLGAAGFDLETQQHVIEIGFTFGV